MNQVVKIMLVLKAIIILVLWNLCLSHTIDVREEDKSLVLVHVLFRHGNRTADSKAELYPNDPYYNKTYFPVGLGQLTNIGKIKEYRIGTYLRARYDNFLGNQIYPGLMEGLSTDYSRTKVSLQYCLAGLFPPDEETLWNAGLKWQALPASYLPKKYDKLLVGTLCPNYLKIYYQEKYSPKYLQEYEKYREDFQYISEHSGLNITSFEEIYNLYFGLSTETEFGLKLPQWLDKVWPEKIIELATNEYYVATGNTELKKLSSGYLLKKIIDDSYAKLKEDPEDEFKKKLFLYSAHENNISHMLITLGVFDNIIPNYASYIIFELHKIQDIHGIKIFYQNYQYDDPILLKIPACDEFCPLDQFRQIFEEYLPADDDCGN